MPEPGLPLPPVGNIPRLAEHLFRQEAGKLVSILTGIFGLDRLQMAEDVVQEALVRALQTWPFHGVPANPTGWLMQTARRLALDLIRRENVFRHKEPEIIATIEQRMGDRGSDDAAMFDDEIQDGRLRLIFACCHPLIPQEAQTALALKTLCGFSPAEIASAFLVSESAIAKRLTRARQRIQEQKIPFEIPSGAELQPRLESVLQIVYLLFNEGYKASSGDSLVRSDLCHEAIRLARLLTEHPAGNHPRTHALLALMLMNAARLPARSDHEGNIVRLEDQDRLLWDGALISLGIHHLAMAAAGDEVSEYHLQAGIAACHCTATDYASTDWVSILGHYDHWLTISDSPLVELNRAVAVAHVKGPDAGIDAVAAIPNRQQLDSYYLTYAVLGEFECQRENFAAAAGHFRKALDLTTLRSERSFLEKRLSEHE